PDLPPPGWNSPRDRARRRAGPRAHPRPNRPAPGRSFPPPHRRRSNRRPSPADATRAHDWSYDLLSEPERVLLRRLSVFAGGWTLEEAETICAGEGLESDDILDLLSGL